jgi:antitoxin component YwqK of YwqJK toxin-antitoxin module
MDEVYFRDNGQIEYRCTVLGDEYKKFESWYRNGQTQHECTYLKNKLHGNYKSWYESGQKECECTLFEGKLHGKYEEWDEQGKLISIEDFIMEYKKKYVMKIYYTLRKAKYIRLAKLTKTKSFNEWWYSPDNQRGKLAKSKLEMMFTSNKILYEL